MVKFCVLEKETVAESAKTFRDERHSNFPPGNKGQRGSDCQGWQANKREGWKGQPGQRFGEFIRANFLAC